MGDASDDCDESGMESYVAHLHGNCDTLCPYCEDEDDDAVEANGM